MNLLWLGSERAHQHAQWCLVVVGLLVYMIWIWGWKQGDGCVLVLDELGGIGRLLDHETYCCAGFNDVGDENLPEIGSGFFDLLCLLHLNMVNVEKYFDNDDVKV